MLPFLVRHCAWLMTHYQVKSDGKTPYDRRRGRPYQGQVAEFSVVVHFRDPRKAADMPMLDDRWNLGLWLGKSLVSDEHRVGTSAGVRRCRSIWRRPEKQRWDRKMLTEMNGEPWNPTAHHQDRPPQVRGVYIALERQIKHGGTKGCAACFGNAKVHSEECRARFQDIVDDEAAQTAAASASEPNVEMHEQAAGGSAPSSSGGPVPAAGRPAPEDANMDAHKLVALAAMPDDQGKWTQRVIDWDKKYFGAKSGDLLDKQKVYEGRLRELANIEKLEVAEPIQLQEARAQNLETVYGKWLDDVKGTPEDPEAVRSRLVATQVNTYAREDVTQATPPIKASRTIVSQAATKTNAKGQHDCLIARHDIGVAFFHAKGSGRVEIIPPKGLAPPGVGWKCV